MGINDAAADLVKVLAKRHFTAEEMKMLATYLKSPHAKEIADGMQAAIAHHESEKAAHEPPPHDQKAVEKGQTHVHVPSVKK
jgi:hypothetical protein